MKYYVPEYLSSIIFHTRRFRFGQGNLQRRYNTIILFVVSVSNMGGSLTLNKWHVSCFIINALIKT